MTTPLSGTQETQYDNAMRSINAYVYILQPTLVFEAPLTNAVYREGAIVALNYGTPTVGVIGDVGAEMTVEIDYNGYADGGRQRVRGSSHTSDTLYVGRCTPGTSNGQLKIDSGGTIRVYQEYRPFIKAPWINEDDGEQYKDEQTYPGDNAAQPPIANIGPDRFVLTDDDTYEFTLDALGVYPSIAVREGATLTGFSWDIDDGTVLTGNVNSSTLTVSFPRGRRYVSLTVTDSNGITHTTHALYVVDDGSNCTPAQLSTMTFEPTLASADLRMWIEDLELVSRPGAKVMISEIDSLDKSTIIGYQERLSGWLSEEQVEWDGDDNAFIEVTALVNNVGAFLQSNHLFPQSLNIAEGTGGWYAMPDANIDRMIHYMLHWHSNVLSMCTYVTSNVGNYYPFPALTTSGESFYDSVDRLARAFAHEMTIDAENRIQIIRDPHIQASADQQTAEGLITRRFSGVVTTFTESRTTRFRLPTNRQPTSYWLIAEGIIASASVDTVVKTIAPGNAPNFGNSGGYEGSMLVRSQSELDVWMANRFAAEDGTPIGQLTISVLNPAHIINVADRYYIGVTFNESVRNRYNLTETDNRWVVDRITYTYTDGRKEAEYTCSKERIAAEKAYALTITSEDPQVWDGWDDIPPFSGIDVPTLEGTTYGLSLEECILSLLRGTITVDSVDLTDCVGEGGGGSSYTFEVVGCTLRVKEDGVLVFSYDIPGCGDQSAEDGDIVPPDAPGYGTDELCESAHYVASRIRDFIYTVWDRAQTEDELDVYEDLVDDFGYNTNASIGYPTLKQFLSHIWDQKDVPGYKTTINSYLDDVTEDLYCSRFHPATFYAELEDSGLDTASETGWWYAFGANYYDRIENWMSIGREQPASHDCSSFVCSTSWTYTWTFKDGESTDEPFWQARSAYWYDGGSISISPYTIGSDGRLVGAANDINTARQINIECTTPFNLVSISTKVSLLSNRTPYAKGVGIWVDGTQQADLTLGGAALWEPTASYVPAAPVSVSVLGIAAFAAAQSPITGAHADVWTITVEGYGFNPFE